MIHDLKPYPAMKDSGVPWLGQVPEHWDVRRLKYLLRERDQRSSNGQEQLLRVSQYTGVTERKRADGGNEPDTRAASLVGYKKVAPDELVVNIMLAWNGSMGVSHYAGIASPAYCVYGFNQSANPWYFHHLLRSPSYKARIKAVSTGVVESRLRLYTDDLFRLEALLPPQTEQAAIVRYLDHADRRIRKAITAKQRLIKLLQEQKQVIIHQAVTRGLNPDVKLKPSGVEWLGDVPEGWEVKRLGASVASSVNGVWGGEPDGLNDIVCLRVADFDRQQRRIRTDKLTFRSITVREQRGRLLALGDLLIEKSGGGDQQPVGNVVLFDQDLKAVTSNFIGKISVVSGFNSKYLVYLHAALYYIRLVDRSIKQTTGIQNLDLSSYLSELVAFPPIEEQTAIVVYLETQTTQIDQAIARAQSEISLLREYRTRLIADVVTGKLDVREAAARLPEPEQDTLPEELNAGEDEGLEGDDEGAEDVEE